MNVIADHLERVRFTLFLIRNVLDILQQLVRRDFEKAVQGSFTAKTNVLNSSVQDEGEKVEKEKEGEGKS